MITINTIRTDKESIKERLIRRNFNETELIDKVASKDEDWRAIKTELDQLQANMNTLSKSIGQLMQQGKKEEAEKAKTKTADLKGQIQAAKEKEAALEKEIFDILFQIPNPAHPEVPLGKSDEDNVEIFNNKAEVNLPESAHPHWELARKYDLIDFETGVKVTGAGFPFYKGKGAKLQRSLIHFFLNEAAEAGYEEYIPPLLINEDSGVGTGQLPDKEGQMYRVTADDLYLIPTAEVPLTNIYRNELLKEEDLPIRLTGYTPCFRREAGSYGKDVRGLNRLHQFDKVEIVRFEKPENSYAALDQMIEHVKRLLEKLELPYRIVRLCGGDLGFAAAITYDFEVYSAAQKKWLEVSSISNFETYQSNRLKCRYKNSNGKKEWVHTLNGSALALPRILAAVLENNQTEKGVKIPKVLTPLTGFDVINL